MDPEACRQHGFDQESFLGPLGELGRAQGTQLAGGIGSGVCQTLALRWIQLKLGEVASKSRASSASRMGAMTASFFSAASLHAQGRAQSANPMAAAERAYGLRVLTRSICTQSGRQCSAPDIAALLRSNRRACFLYRLAVHNKSGADIGTHAIAMYVSSGKAFGFRSHVYVFDPNFGEYKVNAGSIESWLRAHRQNRYNVGGSQVGDEIVQYVPARS